MAQGLQGHIMYIHSTSCNSRQLFPNCGASFERQSASKGALPLPLCRPNFSQDHIQYFIPSYSSKEAGFTMQCSSCLVSNFSCSYLFGPSQSREVSFCQVTKIKQHSFFHEDSLIFSSRRSDIDPKCQYNLWHKF